VRARVCVFFQVTLISFIQVLLLIQQMEVTNTQAAVSKISLVTIGQQVGVLKGLGLRV
jgi:hypothetical protein